MRSLGVAWWSATLVLAAVFGGLAVALHIAQLGGQAYHTILWVYNFLLVCAPICLVLYWGYMAKRLPLTVGRAFLLGILSAVVTFILAVSIEEVGCGRFYSCTLG